MAVVTLNFKVLDAEKTADDACADLSETAAQRVRAFLEGALGGGTTLAIRLETNFGRCQVLSAQKGETSGKD